MPSNSPSLIVWDSCCVLGYFNRETDKLAGLQYEINECSCQRGILGIATATLGEIVYLADNSPAYPVLEKFLKLPFIQQLNNNQEVGLLSSRLGHRFDLRDKPDSLSEAKLFGCPVDQKRLKSKDAEILATSIVYKASRLTTYDPFIRFIGQKYIRNEYGVVVDTPSSALLPFNLETPQII